MSGEQSCELYVTEGMFKGKTIRGVNFLSGSLERDKIYKTGDRAYVTISHQGDQVTQAVMTDHFRLGKEAVLLILFFGFLLLFAGKKSVQAIFSFIITVLAIWKILIPSYLRGIASLRGLSESESDQNLYGRNFYRRQRLHDGSVRGHYIGSMGSGAEETGYFRQRSRSFGNECRQSGDGHDDDNLAPCLFRKLCHTDDGVHGAGDAGRSYPELPVCGV